MNPFNAKKHMLLYLMYVFKRFLVIGYFLD
jgi:hypothetical protein